MLIETERLRIFLTDFDLSSSSILEEFWLMKGNIFDLIPKNWFKRCSWKALPRENYGVLSYQWISKWRRMADFIFGLNGLKSKYVWLDWACLNQLDGNRMATIRRSDEIYFHAKEYHLMEVGSLSRGWVLFELSSVPKTLLPITHFTTSDPNMLNMAKATFKRTGFDGCKFSKESDRSLVRGKILEKYGDMQAFNSKIAAIVDSLL